MAFFQTMKEREIRFFDAFEGKISLSWETKSVFFILKKAILSKNEQYGFWLSVAGFGNGLL